MKHFTWDPNKDIKLKKERGVGFEEEELELLESIEKGEWKNVKDLEKEKERYKEIASNTIRKDKRINIRISERDLKELQKRALEEGIPYQTLVSSLLHKYINGRLIDANIIVQLKNRI